MSGRVIWSDGETELIERRGRLTVTGDGEGVSVTADALRGMVAALDAGEAMTCEGCGTSPSASECFEYNDALAHHRGHDSHMLPCGPVSRRAPQPSPAAALARPFITTEQSVGCDPHSHDCDRRGEVCCWCEREDDRCADESAPTCPNKPPTPAAALVEALRRLASNEAMGPAFALGNDHASRELALRMEFARAALSAHDAASEGWS